MTASRPCTYCHRPIRWARTTGGKLMPLDPEPTDKGNVEIVNGRAVVHGQPPLTHGALLMPHFATYPNWTKR